MYKVWFVGGELDQQVRVLADLPAIYKIPYYRHRMNWTRWREEGDFPIETKLDVRDTEYILCYTNSKMEVPFYVEREFLAIYGEIDKIAIDLIESVGG